MPIPNQKYARVFMEAFLVVSTVLLVGLMLWGLDRGFDITDEGYNLLGLLGGQEKQTIYSALQFVLLSKMFGWVDGLVQSRILSLVLTSLSALVFSWGFLNILRRFYAQRVVFSGLATSAWLLGSSFFFNVALSLTFSYNVFINCCMLVTGGLGFYAFSICDQPGRVIRQHLAWGASGAMLLAALFVKPTAAVLLTCLFMAGGVLFSSSSRQGFFKTQCASLLIGAVVGLALLQFGLGAIQPVLQTLSNGLALHPAHMPMDLLRGLKRDGLDLLNMLLPHIWLIVAVALFGVFAAYSKKVQTAWAGRTSWIFTALLALAAVLGIPLVHQALYDRTKRVPLLSDLIVILLLLAGIVGPALVARLKLTFRPRLTGGTGTGAEVEKLVAAGILLFLPFAAAFGTNNLLYWQLWLHITPWLALVLVLFQETQFSRWSGPVGWVILAFTAAWFWSEFVVGYLIWPYRLVDNRVINSEPLSVRSSRLNGIKVDAQTKAFLEAFDTIIAKSKFQPGDGMIMLYDMPGMVYLVGGYSPGEPWYMIDESWYNTLLESMLTSKLARKSQYLVTNQTTPPVLLEFLDKSEISFPYSYRQLDRIYSVLRNRPVTIYERRR